MHNLRFDGPGRYLVITKGGMDSEVSELFEVVEVKTKFFEGEKLEVFAVNVKDQSELMGFLNTLNGCRHTVIEVAYQPEKEPSNSRA